MATIKQDQTNEEVGQDPMNTQASQQPMGQATPQPQAPAPSGGGSQQSSTIQTGQTQPNQPPAPSSKPKKGVGSGMHSNLNKYKQANAPQVQKMASKMTQNVQKRAGDVRSAAQAKEQQFNQATASERARLGGGMDYAQGLIQRASSQQDMGELERQQAALQGRLDQFGNLQEGGYQTQLDANQAAIQDAQNKAAELQAAQEAAQGAIDPATQAHLDAQKAYYQNIADTFGVDMGQDTYNIKTGQKVNIWGNEYDEYKDVGKDEYAQHLINEQQNIIDSQPSFYWDSDSQRQGEQQRAAAQALIDATKDTSTAYGTATSDLTSAQDAYKAAQEAYAAGQTDISGVERTGRELAEQQRVFENQQRLQGEMSALEDKIKNAPEAVTEDELKRFEALREGVGRFQDIKNINLAEETRKGRALEGLASRIPTEKGQQELLRNIIGRSDYSRGQSALDSFLIGSNKDARESLIRGVQGATKGLGRDIEGAQQRSTKTLGALSDQARSIKEAIGKDLTTSQDAITTEIQRRMDEGEGTFVKSIQDKIASGQGLTQQEMQALGFDKDSQMYDFDPTSYEYNKDDYSMSDFTRGSDIARAEALASLAGRTGGANVLSSQMDTDAIRKRLESGEMSTADAAMAQQMKDQLDARRQEFANLQSGSAGSNLSNWASRYHAIRGGAGTHSSKAGQMYDLIKQMSQAGGWNQANYQAGGDAQRFQDFKDQYFNRGFVGSESGVTQDLVDMNDPQAAASDTRSLSNLVARDWRYYDDN